MISFFNKMGNSWIAKGIFFLLGVSMLAFWGIGGLTNTSTSDGTAITVAGNQISLQEVSQTFDQERNKMAKISGGYMTPKRAIQAGLLDQVVQQLVDRELNLLVQEEIGLFASDDAVRKYIERNPVFYDNLGKFDANLFYAYLSGMNMSQAEFAHQLRSELARQHLTRTLERSVPRDPKLMAVAAQAKKEKREIIGVLLTPENMKMDTPDPQELKDYYEAYMEEFSIPEYRDLRVVFLKPADFKNDYDKMYEASHQLEDLLGAGKTLREACQELKLDIGQVITTDLSGKDKSGKEMKEVAPLLQEAFALSEGEATSLMDINGGFMVAGVEKITPRGYKDFNSVRLDVEKLWRREQQKSALTKTSEKLLDSLKQDKGWMGYTPVSYTISQTEMENLSKKLISVLFQQKVGSENALSIPQEKGIFVGYVKRIIPSTTTPEKTELDEAVKDWYQDLVLAVQHSYGQKYPVKINTSTIQKAFSVYENQEE